MMAPPGVEGATQRVQNRHAITTQLSPMSRFLKPDISYNI